VLKFLVDESSGGAIAGYLKDAGHDVLLVGEVMPQADDTEILTRAFEEQRIVITNDKDFGELAVHSGQPNSGVVLLRLRDEGNTSRVRVIAALVEQYAGRLSGNFVVVKEKSVRIRQLGLS
jgi:predicted nuclease of predicted toxin-antitoxin system